MGFGTIDIGLRILVSLSLSEDFGSVHLCDKFEAALDEFAGFFYGFGYSHMVLIHGFKLDQLCVDQSVLDVFVTEATYRWIQIPHRRKIVKRSRKKEKR